MFVEGERAYAPGVFYCKDAFEGLETMDALHDPSRSAGMVEQLIQDARDDIYLRANVGKDIPAGVAGGERRAVRTDHDVPAAPLFGTRLLRDLPLHTVPELAR